MFLLAKHVQPDRLLYTFLQYLPIAFKDSPYRRFQSDMELGDPSKI